MFGCCRTVSGVKYSALQIIFPKRTGILYAHPDIAGDCQCGRSCPLNLEPIGTRFGGELIGKLQDIN
jgi:hypothetical protein